MSKLLLSIVCLGLIGIEQSFAINWQGHEDWLADAPPALELERHIPNAVPLPPKSAPPQCQKLEDVGVVPKNPYEPVPLLCGETQRPSR